MLQQVAEIILLDNFCQTRTPTPINDTEAPNTVKININVCNHIANDWGNEYMIVAYFITGTNNSGYKKNKQLSQICLVMIISHR